MTTKEAFLAMTYFLMGYYERTNSSDIGSLLGDIMLLKGREATMDPAAWDDWLEAVDKVQKVNVEE